MEGDIANIAAGIGRAPALDRQCLL